MNDTLPTPAVTPTPAATPVPTPAAERRYDSASMAMRGRIGAYRLHATHDSREVTAPARRAFLGRFEREVDPDGVLDEAERQRRAEMARKAYFAKLSLRSATKRLAEKRRLERRRASTPAQSAA